MSDQHHTLECHSFWRAGNYDSLLTSHDSHHEVLQHSDFERARVHPKFLHSNATSHKWAFGAIAELLDNAVDEICNGATHVKVDKVSNDKDNSPVLLFQDDGGGMDPDGLRKCMSLGFSSKKGSNTIGQYGNGFKTSTMRLGADVIVFSRSVCATQSVGLLSYTFLRKTMMNDIIVPILDFDILDSKPMPIIYGSQSEWNKDLRTILEWSPFASFEKLLMQFEDIGCHGTKVFIYNLWQDDERLLELDFDDDNTDIRLRDHAKAEKSARTGKISGVQNNIIQSHISNSYRFSLRAYSSVLYLKKFANFSIILRGTPIEQLDMSTELKFTKVVKYRPLIGKDNAVKVTVGFTKEAPLLGTYGINVYNKNRLIKPFWKVHEENGVRGKCVIGILEANFIEPAHDKQDFERSPLYNRLESRLKQIVLEYWNLNCHLIGYQSKCKDVVDQQNQLSKAPIPPIVVEETTQVLPAILSTSLSIPAIPSAPYSIEIPTTIAASNNQREASQQPLIGTAPHLRNHFQPVNVASVLKDVVAIDNSSFLPSPKVNGSSSVKFQPVNVASVLKDVVAIDNSSFLPSPKVNGSSSVKGLCEQEGTISRYPLNCVSLAMMSEENINLFMKREEYKSKETELKHEIGNIENELEETRRKCAELAKIIEARRKNITTVGL